ncbi:helix-turn-helix domain-containing protein [Actinomadura terrae]|uniref:helix-turn-helix domain-containing protein n=1 Tax=Actinomadura terrae TaxID=604353 RepID=UPI001FA6B30A|nr:helix-turn-helix transcriptional regulator [Actinomadura terrae]
MPPTQKRAAISPTLVAFGRRLRRYREAAGLSQERAGRRANEGQGVTGQYVCQVEQGKTRCTREFAETMDRELGANGELVELWDDLVMDAAFPTWFDWPPVEAAANELVSFHLSVVHGLLQTPAYASTLLYGAKDAVAARMSRQEVLTREEPQPPIFSLLLDESVLYRDVGGPEVMYEQLEYLVSKTSERLRVQIVPARGHLGASGSFTIATLEDRTEVAYVESAARGLTLGDPEDLATMSRTLLEVRSLALPQDQSLDLIRRTAEERWT